MAPLPTIDFGGAEVTRLIVGGNPFRGNSHFSDELSREMEAHYTVANIKEALFACERNGINTVQARGDVLIEACIREYRAEGGSMHFIAQTASELRDLHGHVRHLAAFGALGIYVHGTWTDRTFQDGGVTEIRDLLRVIRETGVRVGLGTHMPEVIDMAEKDGWDVDFYMTCLYNLSAHDRERSSALSEPQQGTVKEVFDHADRAEMLKRVRATSKTCLVFKVLAASRLCGSPEEVREAFRSVFAEIKPNDAIVAGMYTKHHDQVAENAAHVRDILGASRRLE